MAVEIPQPTNTGKPLKEQDPRWLLAKRIARSSVLSRSERLPRLLLYICRMYLAQRSDELNEQKIGVAVFRRSPNYDPAADSIVRAHATRLRQRLELYFGTEGANETLRLEIPRGGYLPHFYSAAPQSAEVEPPPATTLPEGPQSAQIEEPAPVLFSHQEAAKKSWMLPFATGLLFALILATALWHLRQDALLRKGKDEPQNTQTAVERRFWESLFPPNRRTLLVTGDSGLVLYETYTRQEVPLSQYLDGSYLKNFNPAVKISRELLQDLGGRRYTSIIDLQLITKLSHLPLWNNNSDEVIFARDLRSDQVEKSNLILVGSRQANPWVGLYEPAMNFPLRRGNDGKFYFLNRKPEPGEKQIYSPSTDDEENGATSVYGLAAYLPTAGGQGKILILSGLWMSGTESAGNFILNDQQFSTFLSSIARKDGSIPSFELLIHTKVFGGNAVAPTVIAKRIYDK